MARMSARHIQTRTRETALSGRSRAGGRPRRIDGGRDARLDSFCLTLCRTQIAIYPHASQPGPPSRSPASTVVNGPRLTRTFWGGFSCLAHEPIIFFCASASLAAGTDGRSRSFVTLCLWTVAPFSCPPRTPRSFRHGTGMGDPSERVRLRRQWSSQPARCGSRSKCPLTVSGAGGQSRALPDSTFSQVASSTRK